MMQVERTSRVCLSATNQGKATSEISKKTERERATNANIHLPATEALRSIHQQEERTSTEDFEKLCDPKSVSSKVQPFPKASLLPPFGDVNVVSPVNRFKHLLPGGQQRRCSLISSRIVCDVILEEDESKDLSENKPAFNSSMALPLANSEWTRGAGQINTSSKADKLFLFVKQSRNCISFKNIVERLIYGLFLVICLISLYYFNIATCCALYLGSLYVLYYEKEITEFL